MRRSKKKEEWHHKVVSKIYQYALLYGGCEAHISWNKKKQDIDIKLYPSTEFLVKKE